MESSIPDLPPEDWIPNQTSFLVINGPGMNALKIPLAVPSAVADGVSVAANWFSHYLGKPSRLVRFDECIYFAYIHNLHIFLFLGLIDGPSNTSAYRPVNSTHTVNFTDMYPKILDRSFVYFILLQESVNELNEHLSEPVSLNRFRANLIVDGCKPFSEDLWDEIEINGLVFHGGDRYQ
ncbi:PREDICTED: mitochondrial amidoxime reducing component 2-like [Erythranthe guttata]|uniref:mitochondrial amidoxime reducing component 2-like n=1 Tax=Erythranthe guttata TaxID=4155 RepID=UPI00064DD73E|nr:PREDICTED: mitochondrial amidoxime reducing component 2-like [Erythranthe guttata]|eukprot:XP_012854347.1 PREDICTED: mitochondrial amidoxime reducing component 2-like [Erythranthe guttata]